MNISIGVDQVNNIVEYIVKEHYNSIEYHVQ